MKKNILTILLVMMMCASVSAQGRNDAFVNDWGGGRTTSDPINSEVIAALPAWTLFGETQNSGPLGSGLLIMAVAGACYAGMKRNKKQTKK